MNGYDRRVQALAISLSALAGYVDAIAFMESSGFFASFMSGNSTRMAVGLVDDIASASMAASLIGTFVGGIFSGSVIGHLCRAFRRPALLLLIALLLALAALISASGGSGPVSPIFPLAFAMGMENAIFEKNGETGLALTYMTGALVRIGHGLAGVALGRKRGGWLPYLLLWAGLASGAVLGAYAHHHMGSTAIAAGAALAVFLSIPAWFSRRA